MGGGASVFILLPLGQGTKSKNGLEGSPSLMARYSVGIGVYKGKSRQQFPAAKLKSRAFKNYLFSYLSDFAPLQARNVFNTVKLESFYWTFTTLAYAFFFPSRFAFLESYF